MPALQNGDALKRAADADHGKDTRRKRVSGAAMLRPYKRKAPTESGRNFLRDKVYQRSQQLVK